MKTTSGRFTLADLTRKIQNNMNDLNEKIIKWADDKGILANGTPEAQLAKTFEEVIETAQAVALYGCKEPFYRMSQPCHLEPVKDGIGDVYVTICIHAKLEGFPSFPEFTHDDRVCDNKYIFNSIGKLIVMLATESDFDAQAAIYAAITTGLIKLAQNHGLTLRECVEHSYNVIARRTGKMQDGVFVRDN